MSNNTYKDLSDYQYEVIKGLKKSKENEQYHFFFKNKKTNKIGIPVPDFNKGNNESYTNKFIETFIFEIFEDKTPSYTTDRQLYVSVFATKKEIKSIKKDLESLYAEESSNVLSSLSHIKFKIFSLKNYLCISFIDDYDFSQNEFSKNAKFNELDFLMTILDFKFLEKNIWISNDKEINKEELIEKMKIWNFYLENEIKD